MNIPMQVLLFIHDHTWQVLIAGMVLLLIIAAITAWHTYTLVKLAKEDKWRVSCHDTKSNTDR